MLKIAHLFLSQDKPYLSQVFYENMVAFGKNYNPLKTKLFSHSVDLNKTIASELNSPTAVQLMLSRHKYQYTN